MTKKEITIKNYAVLSGNTVSNVIVAESLDIAEAASGSTCIECDGSFWINWTLIDGVWTAPEVVDEPEAL
jgi:hypothetical protein